MLDVPMPPEGDEARLLRDTMRRFVDQRLIPLEAQHPSGVPMAVKEALRDEAAALGLHALDVPEEGGGSGLSHVAQTVFWEELGRAAALPARESYVFGPLVGAVLAGLRGDQKLRWLDPVLRGERSPCFAQTEADAGSDPGAMRTRAVRDGDGYVITGVKRFITGADKADFAQVVARTDPAKGTRGLSLFLVNLRAPGVRVGTGEPTLSGDRPCEVVFDGVRVPAGDRVGAEGDGFRLGQAWITHGRVMRHGARSCGVAERCLEMGATQARARTTFGAPLADRQAVRFMLADTYRELQSARALTLRAAAAMDAGADARLPSWLAKVEGTECALRAADRCLQIHGGSGLTTALPIERMWREARSFTITEGPAEVMRDAIARQVLDLYAGRA